MQRVKWALAVFPGWGVTNDNQSQLSWFHGCVWSRSLDRLCMAPVRAWHLGWGTRNTNMAKRAGPRHLSSAM